MIEDAQAHYAMFTFLLFRFNFVFKHLVEYKK